MFSVKKIIFSLLLLPFLFSLGSLITPQKAHAATYKEYTLQVGAVIDGNNNNGANERPTDPCYGNNISVEVTDATGTHTYDALSTTNCRVNNITVKMNPTNPVVSGLGDGYYNVKLIESNKILNYIYIYNQNPSAGSITKRGTDISSKSVSVSRGDRQVIFGLKPLPFCDVGNDWGPCRAKNEGGVEAECGSSSGEQTKTLIYLNDTRNCTPKEDKRNCKPSAAAACRSDVCTNDKCVAANPTKTLTFSGYVFIDNGAGSGTAGNGIKDGSETFYHDPYTVQADGRVNSTLTGYAYDLTRTTTENSVKVELNVPPGYTRTQLNHVLNGKTVKANSNSVTLSKSATVNFGIKPNSGGDTGDACDNNSQCGSGKYCKNPNTNTSTCVSCLNDNQCSGGKVCNSNNVCVAPNNPPPTNTPSCDKNAPTLEITPNNRNGNPGDEKEYEVKVINKDKGTSCDPVDFVLSKERMPGSNWTGKFDDNTLTNIPKNGGSKTTKFKVKSANGAASGPKTITLGVKRQGQATAQKKVNTTYTVNNNAGPTPTLCNKNQPDFIVTPESITSAPGEEADYSIEIINKDTGTCTPKTLSLSAVFQNNDWQAFFGKESPFDLDKGAKQITNVRIKSPANATPGTKKITLNIKNPNNTIVATKDINYVLPGVTPTQCVQGNPEFSISPQTKNGNPGEAVTYDLTIKNTDQGECTNRTFNLTATPPSSEWATSFSQESSSFNPNETKNINVTITSPSNTPVGEHVTVFKLLENNVDLGSIVAVYNVLEEQITPVPGNTYLNFRIGIDGIGSTPRVPIGGNKNPNNIWRGLNFRIYNTTTNTLSFTGTNITFNYNQDSEKFELLYDLPSVENLPNGSYNIYMNGPGFLTNQYPGSFSINQGQVTDLTSNNFYLITGNVNNSDLSENRIDLMDYNLMLSCSIYSQDRTACDQGENNQTYTDLNDDGIVNEDDYTLFLKEFANQQGVILPD